MHVLNLMMIWQQYVYQQKTGEMLNYRTKEECEATTDDAGNPKESGTYDNQCSTDSECPFYLKNTNYENTRGKCLDTGFCELPINIQSLSYKNFDDEDEYYPYCYGCPIDKMDGCCKIQEKIIDGTATDDEIAEHGLENKEFSSPDYAFKDDFNERLTYQSELNDKGLEVN